MLEKGKELWYLSQFVPLQAQNGVNSFGNESFMEPIKRLRMQAWRVQIFPFLGRGEMIFFCFSLVLKVFQ
jgi:hypothetical protein